MRNFIFILIFFIMHWPMIAFAQYAPEKQSSFGIDAFIADVIAFVLNVVQFLIGVWTLYILLIAFIAAILYITSGGDENRMDTAISWWKKCAVGIVLAPITYVIVLILNDVLQV